MFAAPDLLSEALERTLGNFAGVVRRVAWRYHFSGADVDELVQEVRIRLWRAHGDQESAHEKIAGVPASYLHRTALSAAIDLLRRRRARRSDQMITIEDDDPPGIAAAAGPEEDVAESELMDQVERAIEAIHPSRRPAVRMHLMGHSQEEIARVMGWTQPKTRNLVYRGLADVRARLEAQGIRWTSQT